MGILNVTPDSFSDGGSHPSLDQVLDHAEAMIAAGVDIIDIGGESTRPGCTPVTLEVELQRVMPVLYALRDCGKPLSIDTYKPLVMREAQIAGVDMINDVQGFRASGAIAAVAQGDCGLCIMHMQNTPETMQIQPHYTDIVDELDAFFLERVTTMQQAGISQGRLMLDVGFGFGKSVAHNVTLLQKQSHFERQFSLPMLAGLSRKSMIGALTGKPVEQRLAGSLAGMLASVSAGARIVRVHDVAETVDALAVWHAVQYAN
jgi:dihydropteroate synthase